jgi:ABC-2 type transport system ATP-binding protein
MEPLDKVIICDKLTKKFGDFTAVNEISFDVKKGEIFGFLGANGAGKTTAIKMLIGLLLPSSGSATVAGFDVNRESENIKKKIGYMSQHFSLYQDMTIKENIRFYGGIYGLKSAEIKKQSAFLIKKLGLEDFKDRYVSELPLGWKQKLAFSIAIIHDPSIVFLDEPTSGVDPITRRQFWGLIYEAAHNGITVFVTTHYLEEAEYCDRVSIMVDGDLKDVDTPFNLKKKYDKESMNEVFLHMAANAKNIE